MAGGLQVVGGGGGVVCFAFFLGLAVGGLSFSGFSPLTFCPVEFEGSCTSRDLFSGGPLTDCQVAGPRHADPGVHINQPKMEHGRGRLQEIVFQ